MDMGRDPRPPSEGRAPLRDGVLGTDAGGVPALLWRADKEARDGAPGVYGDPGLLDARSWSTRSLTSALRVVNPSAGDCGLSA